MKVERGGQGDDGDSGRGTAAPGDLRRAVDARRRQAGTIALAALAICAVLAARTRAETSNAPGAPTQAQTSATIDPTLTPDRAGAKGSLTLAIQYAGGELGVPSPVRRTVLRLPAGLSLEVPSLRSCSAAQLQADGPGACPAASKIGHGHALAEVLTSSQLITEEVAVWAFIGPPQNGEPTLELLGEGTNPVPAQVVVTGTVLAGHAPYGEELVIPIPPVPTLPFDADTSMVNLSLTIGTSERRHRHDTNSVVVPSRCPAGGFPFAAEFTYASGSTGSAFAKVPCPPRARARRTVKASRRTLKASRRTVKASRRTVKASSAKTVSLNETGRLHLTSKHGFTLEEQGSASGTLTGTIHVRLTIVSSSHVKAEVSIDRGGGSIAGTATASYHRASASVSFSGSLSIGGGTGSYSHAHGSGLSFGGTIQNANDAITVHLSGPVSD